MESILALKKKIRFSFSRRGSRGKHFANDLGMVSRYIITHLMSCLYESADRMKMLRLRFARLKLEK